MKLNIKSHNLTDIINLKHGIYNPLKEFVSKEDFLNIVNNLNTKQKKFFPFPIFFNVSLNVYKKIRLQKKLNLYYKSIKVCELNINSFYKLDKIKIGSKIFGTRDKNHPGFKHFLNTGEYFLDADIKKFNNKILKKVYFISPDKIKKKIFKKNLRTVVGFHTRNVPHKGHEWIHNFGLKKCDGLLIQPMIGQFRKYEFKDQYIIKTNLILIKKIYKNPKIFFAVYNSYPKYGGPREAMLHAIVRKNYGCSHFLIGRDHAGVKNYYKKYESQKICKKYEKKLGIKIIIFNEPFLCNKCHKIINIENHGCTNNSIQKISGTFIRTKLKKKKKIPLEIMRLAISSTINKNSIINK